ncbi:MAG TPA: sigma-70 family RNA polymerase sigma factor, partial [Iamia sp.]
MRSVDVSDASLVARAQRGDDSAYAVLYERYEPVVSRIVTARLGDQGDPADVVQEVFTVAWCRLGSLRDPSRLRPWMSQIARRTSIDHGRRHRRRPTEHLGEALARTDEPALRPARAIALHQAVFASGRLVEAYDLLEREVD